VQRDVHLGGPLQGFQRGLQGFFPKNPPARIFFCVPEWTGPFDVEVDCIAVTKD
jgi:2-iminobutanoate/2-iminopropanoate deaminase